MQIGNILVCSMVLFSGLITSESQNGTNLPNWHVHLHEEEGGNVTFNVTLDAITLEESYFFIQKLFVKYGDQHQLNLTGFTKLLNSLGLGIHSHDDHHQHKRSLEQTHVHSSHQECLSVSEILEAFHLASHKRLTKEEFVFLCPALLHQLDLEVCHHHQYHQMLDEPVHAQPQAYNIHDIPAKVWGYSFIAVLIISLVGLLGVAVIPIMQKVFYNHLLQFLVALAIGALSGDALLHLLPHALMGSHESSNSTSEHKHEGDGHEHTQAAWKGLMALGGILFFFITERLLTIVTVIKRNRNSERQIKKKRCEQFCAIESNKAAVGSKLSHRQASEDECDRTVMLVHPNKVCCLATEKVLANMLVNCLFWYFKPALKSYADAAHDEFLHQCDEELVQTSGKSADCDVETSLMELSTKNMDSNNGVSYSKTGHSHGHAHTVPNSVSAVAWMVILGDGIHNFSDGLAIGASFANSIIGGMSTSIAVFCHELPHEIGDFAVLLRAGMTVKQAVLYNCLSSLLCLIGMVIGVAIGNVASASLWVFAIVGGMFLYIALVDMLPEMSSVDPKKGENPFLHLLIQVAGILLGSGIMLLIALYEDEIKKSFS
ncbi:zinc transporter ZIP10-like [Physella acuta]|uniref:zinc transporter ZIP10-like n=1 Tax=Physella acuta TaxID=109671 RepID=UPI0027DAC7CB|nr:zinc transporter ZIP10-like [Physella acuta]